MYKKVRNILNISLKVIRVIVLFILFLYFGLWIYITKTVPEELKQYYDQFEMNYISDNKYQIIWFVFTGNKNYGFKRYPFIIDRLFEGKNNIESYVSFNIINTNEKYRKDFRSETWNVEYGLSRYIRWDNNYKKCMNYIINYGYFGNNIFGIVNASEYYFKKRIDDLTERELISLVLFINSGRYRIGSDLSENKINEIINTYNN